jgi:hypothetical protein
MFTGPLIERAAGKFRALIGSYRHRIVTRQRNALQNTRGLNALNPESGGDRQAHPGEIIHTGQSLDPGAAGESIPDKSIDQVRFGTSGRRSGSRSVASPL